MYLNLYFDGMFLKTACLKYVVNFLFSSCNLALKAAPVRQTEERGES